ncbi:SET domain-containing protein [Pochonia chlamydosporia 170]|uniref:SET domain-containing protein n=1 Tax=Pochonia chlamydosporia 170 TaxID=1380566 RepID=A0A179F3E3_METCM|nr:SET domain-containing protein [Pochonia chlamydosporia 170]OAQ59649.1 SET domain-containing protein [Pochonia chlamydosporia 170]
MRAIKHREFFTVTAYLGLHILPNAPFQLKPSPGKGWGAFATREIKIGELILAEKPICAASTYYGRLLPQELQKAIDSITDADMAQLSLLRDNTGKPFMAPQEAFMKNSFGTGTMGNLTLGLYLLQPRFNHSCVPNAIQCPGEDTTISRYACKDIAPGEESIFCYDPSLHSLTKTERHERLGFICKCTCRELAPPLQQVSNLRRRLYRGLRYLSQGKDIDGPTHMNSRRLITNLALKKAAENFELPISELFYYSTLAAVVAEEEGILDYTLAESIKEELSRYVIAFMTPRNMKVAKLAMMKTTWIVKLELAVSIRGQRDEFDAMYTMVRKGLARS